MPDVRITPKGLRWWRTGHPWLYRDDLVETKGASPERSRGTGELVRVIGPGGEFLGQYFYNPRSKIALRLVRRDEGLVDRGFWAARLRAAIAYRERVVRDATAYRLIASESDGFPGLIVDRYADVLVLQSASAGIEALLPMLVELLVEACAPSAIVARHDGAVRALEGLPPGTVLLHGTPPARVEIQEGDCRFRVDVMTGQKTGWYLDQRETRGVAAGYARGRVLDLFAYQGGFACRAARRAAQVIAVESSEAALAALGEQAALNGLTNVTAVKANVFDYLKAAARAGERWDLIVLDPPAFAKRKTEVAGAQRGYKDLNLRALTCLAPGGRLITCSCSHNVSEALFLDILRDAAADARREVRVAEVRTQAADHPILLSLPESHYLKCAVLEAL